MESNRFSGLPESESKNKTNGGKDGWRRGNGELVSSLQRINDRHSTPPQMVGSGIYTHYILVVHKHHKGLASIDLCM